MPSRTIREIKKAANGRVYIRTMPGKVEREFASVQAMLDWANDKLSVETLDAIIIAMIAERQPNLNNVAALEGKSLNVNLAVNNWGTVS